MRRVVKALQLKKLVVFFLVGVCSWCIVFFSGGSADVRDYDRWKADAGPYPGDQAKNIFWFVQVTDIHITYFNNMHIATPFLEFCREMVTMVRPSLVLATGDLTHAKFPGERLSQQFKAEWEEYGRALQECRLGDMPWLDIRGNHDDFDVPSFSHPLNYFKKYSESGKGRRSKSYSYLHRTEFGEYNFIAMDACPTPGPRRPFNFFGILNEEDLHVLRNLTAPKANHTVWFSHYPSSIITADHRELRRLVGSSVAHVCGHLHTLHGYMHRFYGRHPGGHLELELGHFTGTRKFRLMAIDHDLFSFADLVLGKWPYVLITNPKDARFLSREPVKRMLSSTHVRLLVFGPHEIKTVKLLVDGHFHSNPRPVQGGPLYVSPWQPAQYAQGMHEMKVEVEDGSGVSRSYSQPFSLDGTLSPLEYIPQLVLLSDIRSVLQWMFLFLWLSLVISLVSSRLGICGHWFLGNLVQARPFFFSYLVAVVYFGLGPWYVGEMLTGHYGFVCMHGVYVMGTFLPGSMTYLNGNILLVGTYIPLGICLNMLLSPKRGDGGGSSRCGLLWHACCYTLMLTSVLVQCVETFQLAYPYGPVAFLLSPGCTWLLLLNLYLLYSAHRARKRIGS